MAEQANYQGEHLGLSLNRDAVFALNDALEQLRYSVRDRTSAAVPLRLPDGRTLQLRLSLTNAGEIRDANGEYLDDDGIAHGDVTGDLAAHVEARMVLDAAARPGLAFDLTREQLDGEEPVDVDQVAARRVDAALAALPYRYGRSEAWVEQLRARAVEVARAELPEVLDRQQAFRRQVLADRDAGVGAEAADPAPGSPAATAEDGQRYTYRGLTLDGGELVERLIADGLASPAARDDAVDEVVFQVVEANAVDFDDPVDAHAFPRKLSDPVDDPHAQRGLPEAVTRPEQSQAAANDDTQAALKPPARLRNFSDEIRRGSSASVRHATEQAAAATARGDDAAAAEWDDWADNQRQHADRARSRAVALEGEAATADPAGYAQRLAEARMVDAGDYAQMLAEHNDDPYLDRDIAAVERVDAEPPQLRPSVRLRNRFDDDRRAEVEQARQRRGYAVQAAEDGRDSHAGYWAGQADRWDEYAQQSRAAAIAEDGRDRADDPDGHARRLAVARTHDGVRATGSHGWSGEAEVPSWVTAAGEHARQANAREAEVPSWVTAAGEHARHTDAREAGRAASDSRSGGAGMAM